MIKSKTFRKSDRKELQKIIRRKKFLNSQPDHEMDRKKAKIVLRVYLDKG